MRSIKSIFILSIMFAAICPVSSDIYLPSVPFIATSLHTSITLSQLSIAVFVFGVSIARLIFGIVSDAFGRKNPIIVGLVICLVGGFVCLFAPNIENLILGRFLQGFGSGGCNLLARVLLRDSINEKESLAEYNSYFSMANISLISAAPLLGGYLQHYFNWRASFVFLTLFVAVDLIVAIWILSETNWHCNFDYIKPSVLSDNLKALLFSRFYWIYALLLFIAYGAILAWATAGPVLLQDLHGLSAVEFGWIAGLIGFCYFLGAFFNGRFVNRLGVQRLLSLGVMLLLSSGVVMVVSAMLHFTNILLFVVPTMITLFGLAFIIPNSYAAGMMPFPKIAGIAAAVLGSFQVLGGVFTSTIISVAPDASQFSVGVIFLVFGLWGIIILNQRRKLLIRVVEQGAAKL